MDRLMKQFWLKIFTWWNSQTFGTQLWTWRFGELVGEDGVPIRHALPPEPQHLGRFFETILLIIDDCKPLITARVRREHINQGQAIGRRVVEPFQLNENLSPSGKGIMVFGMNRQRLIELEQCQIGLAGIQQRHAKCLAIEC